MTSAYNLNADASLEAMRKVVVDAMEQESSAPNITGDLYLKDSLYNYRKSMQSYSQHLKNEIIQKLDKHGISNNSLQWKINLKNSEFRHFLRPSPIIANDRKFISSLQNNAINLKHMKSFDTIPINKRQLLPNSNVQEVLEVQMDQDFKTAMQVLEQDENIKLGSNSKEYKFKKHKSKKFISPLLSNRSNEISTTEECEDDSLKHLDPNLVKLIKSEIMDVSCNIEWDDIAGLHFAKAAIQEAVVWPMLRPDLFTGLRRPPKGILLFGPPGTGKTLIGKCVASQSKSTFFSISASSLASKYVGEGEKLVRTLFAIARSNQPAVIFIDELDSLLSQRNESEHESSRRIKTEFLVQLDGAKTDSEERLLIIGATNRPQELDEAARRRFVKRLYIPLPEYEGRLQLVKKLMTKQKNSLTDEQYCEISNLTDGYSGADIMTLCSDASLGPIRSLDISVIGTIKSSDVRPVSVDDFRNSLIRVRSSVSAHDLEQYVIWDKTYGSGS